jgi:hypothetical protein
MIFLVLTIASTIQDVSTITPTTIFNTVLFFSSISFLMNGSVSHSDPHAIFSAVDVSMEGKQPFSDHCTQQHHPTLIILTGGSSDTVGLDGEALGRGSSLNKIFLISFALHLKLFLQFPELLHYFYLPSEEPAELNPKSDRFI